jgi:hypothetical protein
VANFLPPKGYEDVRRKKNHRWWMIKPDNDHRLMSDYEVTLVNDNSMSDPRLFCRSC